MASLKKKLSITAIVAGATALTGFIMTKVGLMKSKNSCAEMPEEQSHGGVSESAAEQKGASFEPAASGQEAQQPAETAGEKDESVSEVHAGGEPDKSSS